ncbi:hypothetical protein [Salipiger bermudensis]|nr:hypothetical protein [Salipiger bermudensis]MCA0963657.1 hypothetical protein [Salipiger bermudensis]
MSDAFRLGVQRDKQASCSLPLLAIGTGWFFYPVVFEGARRMSHGQQS